MKIVFLSSYFNHHQKSLSDALWEQTNGNYTFVSTKKMRQERVSLGYDGHFTANYVLDACQEPEKAAALIADADVVVFGSAPEEMIRGRILAGKLVFRYSERPLKNGFEPLKYLPRLLRWHWRNPSGKAVYMLCASGYTAEDYGKFGLFRNRTYRWGYFPETKRYEDFQALMASKKTNKILWCGRFLRWKHPDDALCVANRLRREGYDFELDLIGRGEMETELRDYAQKNHLQDCVRFLGSMSPEQVRSHMEQAGIYLFTSDRQEGWGAVLNESMNSGCAVAASHLIGAVPFLLKDRENGFVYRSEDVDSLYEKVKYLLDHPEEQKSMGTKAYQTILTEWNAECAAQRLIELAECILTEGSPNELYSSGPCSLT